MTTRPPLTPVRVTAAVVLLAAAFGLSPDRAAGACGDYVRIGGHGPMPDGTPAGGCHGPSCSRPPAPTPFDPGTPRLRPAPQELAHLLAAAADDPGRAERFPPSDSVIAPVGRPADVFHPPR